MDNKKKEEITCEYMTIGMCLGISMGMIFDNLAVGLSVGMLVGLVIDEINLKKKHKDDNNDGKDKK